MLIDVIFQTFKKQNENCKLNIKTMHRIIKSKPYKIINIRYTFHMKFLFSSIEIL